MGFLCFPRQCVPQLSGPVSDSALLQGRRGGAPTAQPLVGSSRQAPRREAWPASHGPVLCRPHPRGLTPKVSVDAAALQAVLPVSPKPSRALCPCLEGSAEGRVVALYPCWTLEETALPLLQRGRLKLALQKEAEFQTPKTQSLGASNCTPPCGLGHGETRRQMESGVGWSDGVGPVGQAVGGAPGGGP